mgnify:CR=1 FL=1
MRKLKSLGLILVLILSLCSCSKDSNNNVVFYSKDQLKKDLIIQVDNTDGSIVSVNSNTTISLMSSAFFEENISFLKSVEVPKLSYKIKNYVPSTNFSLSNIELAIDDIVITDYLDVNFLNSNNNGVEFLIEDETLLLAIAEKLTANKQVVISYKSDAVTSQQNGFDFEFSITAKGTFVD